MNKAVIIVLSLVFALIFPLGVNASSVQNCKPIYGGGETCVTQKDVLIDKKVQLPNSSELVDNQSQKDPKFQTGETINFQISITNETNKTMNELEVKDYYPTVLINVSGPGQADDLKNTMTFKVNDLKSKETRKYVVVARIGGLNSDSCFTNYAQVKYKTKTANDNSIFCAAKSAFQGQALEPGQSGGQTGQTGQQTKGGLEIKKAPTNISQTPATGPQALALLGLIPAGFLGYFLRRKSSI